MRVELLFWAGCPSHPRALADLRAAMAELGLDPAEVIVREIDTDADAGSERFVGSPTIRIDGRDVQPPADSEPFGLTCRVYHRRDGRVSPTPDPADLRDALRLAAASPPRAPERARAEQGCSAPSATDSRRAARMRPKTQSPRDSTTAKETT
jgi:hypothetical protein